MKFTWKDYFTTTVLIISIFLVSIFVMKGVYPLLKWLPIDFRNIAMMLYLPISWFILLCVYAKIIRTIVPFKNAVFSANDTSLACFVWKQTVFTYEWTASILSYITPVLLRPTLYRFLGARIGHNVLFAGKIVEPQMVDIGDYSNIGEMALIMAHAIITDNIVLKHIIIGCRVAIGAHAVIMPGVEIGDGSIIGAGAIVLTDTKIPPNEVWGGVPAKKIKDVEVKTNTG
jgi:hypothetical protein